ncbi:hypothetical protein RHSIM_Rhsim02G0084500 [Rhododendron simsii]|uniref:DUF4005 domain-containing protein n=1 Tax=Rhododendron simsii TaxID=118357 RepID=A0A834HD28_RHOSS|nr:hypothetical protein RHSIM_Rhsim02G0084500 [Rhododendron simsii]
MGKKGSWFSTIKRVFTPNSKEKPVDGSGKKSTKEKKKRGILGHGESKSFMPLFREPSSIEQILGEMDQQQLLIRPPTPVEQHTLPPLVLPRAASRRVASPRAASPRVTSPKAASLRVGSPGAASSRALQHHKEISYRPEPTLRYRNVSATKIQAAYRGYMARRGFKALRGLVRLQEVVRGQNVERQTMNTMKMMQLLVRVQTQIQSRRIQMLENQALQRQAYNNDKELESTLGKWTANQSEAGLHEDWDDSVLTKEEIEARLQRKAEALTKRERVMAYSYSHQLWKANPKSAQISPMDPRSGGFPWWWNWLDRQLPPPANPPESQTMKSFLVTPPRPKPSPTPSPFNYKQPNIGASPFNYKQPNIGVNNLELLTPRSTRSATPMRTRYQYTPSNRTPTNSSFQMKHSKSRTSNAGSAFDMKDDDSLMSCPPFSVPNYMTPTASAKAKARESGSILKDRFPGTPGADSNSKKRFSFMLTSNFASFKWNKGSSKDSNPQRVIEKQKSLHSVGDVSIDSAVSMPAAFGRKPFNRFV